MQLEARMNSLIIIPVFLFFISPIFAADETSGKIDNRYKNLLVLGKKSISEKNYSNAIMEYKDAIKLNDQNEKVFVYLGYAYYRNNQPKLAEESFKKEIMLNPQSSLAHYNLALSYWVFKNELSSQETNLAMDELIFALKLDPSLQAKVKEDPKFRGILKMQTFQNSMQVEAEHETKIKKLSDETNFDSLTVITFKEDLVKLSSDLVKAKIISPDSRFAEAYGIDGDDEQIVLKKRFQSLSLDKDDSTGVGYYSEINDTPLIIWMINDITYLIDTRKPTQAMILSENVLNVIETITAKKIKKDYPKSAFFFRNNFPKYFNHNFLLPI